MPEKTLHYRRHAVVTWVFFLILAASLASYGCTKAVDPAPVATISLAPATDSVEIGNESAGFVATLKDNNGKTVTGRRIDWSSSNEGVATVDASGKVHGVALGQAFITASVDGRSATSAVKVIIPLSQIVLNPDSLDVPLTTTKLIIAQLIGPNGEAITGRTITWSSASPAIATVNGGGIVSGVSVGKTTVTATAGSKSATAIVNVTAEPVALVRISPSGSVQIVRLGQTFQLTATCYNSAGDVLPGRKIDWTTGNPSVASVNGSGLVTGLALGVANISAECGSRSASVTVQVTNVQVTSVSLTPTPLNMLVGTQQQLTLTARDSANNVLTLQNRSVNFRSDNVVVATVSGAGVVAALSQGTANVDVVVDGVTSNAIPVTVSNVPVATVQVVAPVNPPNVKVGTTMQLTAILRDANGNVLSTTGRVIQWSSSDPNFATVSAGLVSGLQVGGPITIQATCEGHIGSIQINVVP